jgi:SAM-dependent methyltransferase
MSQEPAASPDHPHQGIIDDAYGAELLRALDVVGREDFYGIVAGRGLRFFAEKMELTPDSRVLELGSGIGGPARFFARTYGCHVTGIDLSAFNHQTALARTKAAGLDHLATFLHGDALSTPLPDETYTHVFGCEAWCYFADKAQAYARVRRALRPRGLVAFLEAACERPLRLRTEELLGPVRYESVARYHALLEEAGFAEIRRFDTTELAVADVSASLFGLIADRPRVIEASGEEVYYGLLELWAEFLACFAQRRMTHCGFLARKP